MLNTSLTHLLHQNEINFPGICSAIAIPKEAVLSMPSVMSLLQNPDSLPDSDFNIEEILLAAGYDWINLTTDFPFDTDVVEEDKQETQGKGFEYQLAFRIPNDKYATRGKVIRAYDNREFIIVAKQRTGAYRVLGSPVRGCFFSAQLNTGKIRKTPNVHECGFTWQSPHRAFYVEPFVLGAYFTVTADSTEIEFVELIVNETVFIDWGDDVSGYYSAGTIRHEYEGKLNYSYRVYHHHRATRIEIKGSQNYNTVVTAITDNLPDELEYLDVSGNDLTSLPTPQFTNRLIYLNASTNELDDTNIEAALETLVLLGAENGTAIFTTQSPSVTPSAGMIAFRATLESRGWTISY